MFRFSFVNFISFTILTTSLYTEAKDGLNSSELAVVGEGYSHPTAYGLSGSSHRSHYLYKPPKHVTYTPHGGASMRYPVYVGSPPPYVYEFRESGSVYGTLLAGLALYNLGSIFNSNTQHNYNPQPGEQCKFGVKKTNGDYEETKIKCDIMTSFIFEEENKVQNTTNMGNTSVVTTTWSNVTTFEMTNGQPNSSSSATSVNVTYTLAPNGTFIPVVTSHNVTNDNGTITSLRDSVTTNLTTNTTTVADALDVKGKELQVTPEMQCYMIRITPASNMRTSVPCGVLQSYAEQSLHKSSATRYVPTIALFAAVFVLTIY